MEIYEVERWLIREGIPYKSVEKVISGRSYETKIKVKFRVGKDKVKLIITEDYVMVKHIAKFPHYSSLNYSRMVNSDELEITDLRVFYETLMDKTSELTIPECIDRYITGEY